MNTRLSLAHLYYKDFKASAQPAAPYILVSANTIPLPEKLWAWVLDFQTRTSVSSDISVN